MNRFESSLGAEMDYPALTLQVMKMGDLGIDQWFIRMEDHKTNGDKLIKYGKDRILNEKELFLKNQRIKFWEQNQRIPSVNDLMCFEAKT